MSTMALDDGIDATSRWGSMWRDLPSEILEKVVTYLPIASVVRFKVVSKKWNRLISEPGFALRHARASSPEEYVLIGVKHDNSEDHPVRSWEVLDVTNKRWFTLSNDFLTEYAKQEGLLPMSLPYRTWNRRSLLAADGGLFCLSYLDEEKHLALLVCNPVLKTVKKLPGLAWYDENQRGVMSTDRLSMEYEVFLINDTKHRYQPNAIYIYESKTDRWRTLSTMSPPRHSYLEFESVSIFVNRRTDVCCRKFS